MGRNFQMRVRFREEFGRPTIRRLIRSLPTPFKSGSDEIKRKIQIFVSEIGTLRLKGIWGGTELDCYVPLQNSERTKLEKIFRKL